MSCSPVSIFWLWYVCNKVLKHILFDWCLWFATFLLLIWTQMLVCAGCWFSECFLITTFSFHNKMLSHIEHIIAVRKKACIFIFQLLMFIRYYFFINGLFRHTTVIDQSSKPRALCSFVPHTSCTICNNNNNNTCRCRSSSQIILNYFSK